MTGLTEAYTGGGADASVRRRYLGGGLFAAGVSLAALGVVFGTTDLLASMGYGLYDSRRIGGVLAGFGVPALLLGVVTLLSAGRRVRLASATGAGLAVIGVLWFWRVYPAHWAGYGRDLTLPVTALYLLGLTLTVGGLFVGVAGVKTRNAPGGTVSLSVLRRGRMGMVESEGGDESSRWGGVGVFGDVHREATPRVDGGTPEEESTGPVDAYCGNCRYVEYAHDDGRIRPYCTHHDATLESMDACGSWTPRERR